MEIGHSQGDDKNQRRNDGGHAADRTGSPPNDSSPNSPYHTRETGYKGAIMPGQQWAGGGRKLRLRLRGGRIVVERSRDTLAGFPCGCPHLRMPTAPCPHRRRRSLPRRPPAGSDPAERDWNTNRHSMSAQHDAEHFD
jgi:hypothetical protein